MTGFTQGVSMSGDLKDAALSRADNAELQRIVSEVKEARKAVEKSVKRSARALLKVNSAREEAAAMGIDIPDVDETES